MFTQRWVAVVCCAVFCASMELHTQTDNRKRDAQAISDTVTVHNTDTSADFTTTQEVVVSASRWQENSRSVSREITQVKPQDIQLYNPATTGDALAQTGKVFVQRSQLGGGSPMLRGYAANAVLLVVDGIRVNNAIYRSGNLQNVITIDANSLDGAEVLFGPGSVQYGSDALGGVMVFRTRQAQFAQDATQVGGTAMLRYGTAMQEKTASAAIDVSCTRLASSTVITYTDFADLRGGSVFSDQYPGFGSRPWYVERIGERDSIIRNSDSLVQTPTGYNQINVMENLAWQASETLTLKYGGLFTTSSNVPRYDRLQEVVDSLPRSAEWFYGPQLWTMHSITATLSDAGPLGDDAMIAASFQYYNESRNDRRFNNNNRRKQDETVLIGAVNADFRVRLNNGMPLERDLYYGIEAYVNDVTSVANRTNIVTGAVTPTATRYPDGGSTVVSAAAYVQGRWASSESFVVAGGLRFTTYDLQSTIADTSLFSLPFTDLSTSTTALTGSIGATWLVAPSLSLNANASSGFRAPNVDDIAKVFESLPGVLDVPNPSLGPEYAYTLEGGFGWTLCNGWHLDANVFHTWGVDAIQSAPYTLNGQDTIIIDGVPTAVYANQNVGRAFVYGGSAELRGRIDWLDVLATAVLTQASVADTNLPLSHIPPAYGSLRANWNASNFNVGASFWWSASKDIDDIPTDDRNIGVNTTPNGVPAWWRVDVNAGWKWEQRIELRLILENIMDHHYRPFASGVSAPGRNLVLSVRGNF